MPKETDENSLKLYNDGVTAIQSGLQNEAIRLWSEAIALRPSLGLEVMVRTNLCIALFKDLQDLPKGTRLSAEQANEFKFGEQCAMRLAQLCKGNASESPVTDIDSEVLERGLKIGKECARMSLRASLGWYILPGDEGIMRIMNWGTTLANSDRKNEAIEAYWAALPLMDLTLPNQRKLATYAHLRLAGCLSSLGRDKEAAHHAHQAIDLGLEPRSTESILMNSIILKSGERPPILSSSATPPQEKKGGCFIATAAFGSEFASEVILFKRFRDSVLQSYSPTRLLVTLYYKVSPPIANFISESDTRRFLVRSFLLKPLSYLLKFWLAFCERE